MRLTFHFHSISTRETIASRKDLAALVSTARLLSSEKRVSEHSMWQTRIPKHTIICGKMPPCMLDLKLGARNSYTIEEQNSDVIEI